jgi:RNA polymerase sigma-70 factor, ECF subfamily
MNLIQAAKFDTEAFGNLYAKYADRVLKFIYYRVPSMVEAEDLFSQAWEKIFKNIKNLETNEELGFQKWMFMVVRNLILDRYRSVKEGSEELSEEWPDENLNVQTSIETAEDHEFLHKMMEHLPPLQREILVLHFFSDLKIKEIAEHLEMEENTVSQNLSRALKKMRVWVEKWA